jgi:hypothetical protein
VFARVRKGLNVEIPSLFRFHAASHRLRNPTPDGSKFPKIVFLRISFAILIVLSVLQAQTLSVPI